MFDVIALDADDTLWHNETLYHDTQGKFRELMAPYAPAEAVEQKLYEVEMSNLEVYGYGIKAFTLSMIETAIDLTGGRIPGAEIHKIIGFARAMLGDPTHLLPGVQEVVARLAEKHDLMLLTKGDPLDQEAKLSRSGLGRYFTSVEILSAKTADSYRKLLARHRIEPARFLMVGNSLRSDILPVIELGGSAVYIPYHITWAHEAEVDLDANPHPYYELEDIAGLPDLVARMEGTGAVAGAQ